jgi:hypothetical protein
MRSSRSTSASSNALICIRIVRTWVHDSDHPIHPAFSRCCEDVAITGVGQRFPTCCHDAPRVEGAQQWQTSAGPKMLSATRISQRR